MKLSAIENDRKYAGTHRHHTYASILPAEVSRHGLPTFINRSKSHIVAVDALHAVATRMTVLYILLSVVTQMVVVGLAQAVVM